VSEDPARAPSAAALPSQDEPPELPEDGVAVLHGSTFMISDGAGDVDREPTGLFHRDTRLLSQFVLRLDGTRLHALSSGQTDFHEARFFSTNQPTAALPPRALSVERYRLVRDGLLERVTVRSHLDHHLVVSLALEADADFADLFDVKEGTTRAEGRHLTEHLPSDGALRFRYRNGPFRAGVDIRVSQPFEQFDGQTAVFRLELPPRGTWRAELRAVPAVRPADDPPERGDPAEGTELQREAFEELLRWRSNFPRLELAPEDLQRVYGRTVEDLGGLRMHLEEADQECDVLAAGLPWFMTLFGRDASIAAFETLFAAPDIADETLRALAALQGRSYDAFRDEEPGRILHELRHGELTVLGRRPYNPYYGAADATPLWLILLSEHASLTGKSDVVAELWPHALAAVEWIERSIAGPIPPFVAYKTSSPLGLVHQGWKDSRDPIRFHDGRPATPPLAVCEVQGYAYDALRRTAALAREIMHDAETADRLDTGAQTLAARFDEAYWIESLGWYAVALDGERRVVDSLTSNVGHLLWSGIVPEHRAERVRDVLMSEPMWSGWGVRTLASSEPGYNPIGYHTGAIWPHDTTIVATGLARYGFHDDAARLVRGMMDAAGYFGARLPEALAGYPRAESVFPVRYPTASSPQAWSAAAPFQWLRLILGMALEEGELVARPPTEIAPIALRGVMAGGRRWAIRAEDRDAVVEPMG
jgi:glycogen debranching enzyme